MTGTLLTTVEVAERLGLSSSAVAQAVRTGALQPTARTADEFLFSERAVAAFAERRARAAASPLQPPAAGTRVEWTGDVDRLNSWLKDLTDAVPGRPPLEATAAVPAPSPAASNQPPAPEPDFHPPPPPHQPVPVAEIQLPPRTVPEPEPAPEIAPPLEPPAAPAPEPEPPQTAPEPEPVRPPDPEPGPPPPPPSIPEPEPEPVAVAEPDQVLAEEPAPALPEPQPVVTAAPEPEATGELFAVQPIVRFAILRQVRSRIRDQEGVLDVRLERLEKGVAWYRILHLGNAEFGGQVAAALAPLGLSVLTIRGQRT